MTCFTRVGMNVPTVAGDCLCGEYVRFDLVHRRAEHFLVCPVVDEIVSKMDLPNDIDEDAVRAGIEAMPDAGDQNRRARRTQSRSQESVQGAR